MGTLKLNRLQWSIIAVCFFCNMLDGMDVLIISFTAPVIATQWKISPEALGLVFSSGLIGMTLGAVALAPFADRYGRKLLMLLAALLMSSSIYLTSWSTSLESLMVFRLLSGLGIGIMMATSAALTAEVVPSKTRGFWVSLIVAGYPVGAVLTGLISASFIGKYGWEQLYVLAGGVSLIALPVLYFFLKESAVFKEVKAEKFVSPSGLFTSNYRNNTLKLWLALFLCFATLYYLISWIPKLASNAGLPLELAIYAGTVFNSGAVFGILVQGYLSTKFGLTKVVGNLLILSMLFLVGFGLFKGSAVLLVILFLLGFGVQGGFVGLYAIAASLYTTQIRATGVGWSIGLGRIGGIIGPVVGGILVAAGFTMVEGFSSFALPIGLAGLLTRLIRLNTTQ
jgi:AAHS family 4-hydroxybenzoate transporter-like MFS transporter